MPTAQRQTKQTSFRTNAGGYGANAAYAYAPSPVPTAPPAPRVAPRPRQRVQTAGLLLMVFAAVLAFALGIAYFYGCALVTKEGYRRAHLKSALQKERDMAQQWEQRKALTQTPRIIEEKARAIHMVPGDTQPSLTVGEKQ